MDTGRKQGGGTDTVRQPRVPCLVRACLASGCTLVLVVLAACAGPAKTDIPKYAYACTHGLSFEARLYSDLVVLEGGRGHDVLPRLKDGADGSHVYGGARVKVTFGLGVDRRLASLSYADIPQTIHCERVQAVFSHSLNAQGAASAATAVLLPLEVSRHKGPRPPEPPKPVDPKDIIYTNILSGSHDPGPN